MSRDEFIKRQREGREARTAREVQYVNAYASSAPIAQDPNAQSSQLPAASRWAASAGTFWGANETYDQIPAGLYRTGMHPGLGPILLKQDHDTDGLLELPDDASLSILQEFDDFWDRREAFRQRGFLHKRGFMLWGPPGSGKTSCTNILIKRLVNERDGIVLFLDVPSEAAQCFRLVRMIERDRPIVAIMEDIDALVHRYGEHEYLALLDGEAQIDRVVFVATTNYPENLDARFTDRPSRFDTIRHIGMPSEAARRVYLKTKEPALTDDELSKWTRCTDGFSLAHLKELIIAVKCLGQSFEDALERIEGMRYKPSSDDAPTRHKAGFVTAKKIGNGSALRIG